MFYQMICTLHLKWRVIPLFFIHFPHFFRHHKGNSRQDVVAREEVLPTRHWRVGRLEHACCATFKGDVAQAMRLHMIPLPFLTTSCQMPRLPKVNRERELPSHSVRQLSLHLVVVVAVSETTSLCRTGKPQLQHRSVTNHEPKNNDLCAKT